MSNFNRDDLNNQEKIGEGIVGALIVGTIVAITRGIKKRANNLKREEAQWAKKEYDRLGRDIAEKQKIKDSYGTDRISKWAWRKERNDMDILINQSKTERDELRNKYKW